MKVFPKGLKSGIIRKDEYALVEDGKMKYVLLEDLRPGMVLAHRLVDADGHIIVGENSKISLYVLEKIKNDGYEGVYIQEGESGDEVLQSIISEELCSEIKKHIQKKDIDGCIKAADKIVTEITEKKDLSLNWIEFRTNEEYIYAHAINVAVLSCLVGKGFELSRSDLRNLALAGLLHDIGKLDIPSLIRNKRGSLTRDEYKIMKEHVILSCEYIRERKDISENVKKAVRSHHENVDGSGYPDGLMGEEQPLFAKIVHAADVYDTLVCHGPHKKPYSPREASEYMTGGCSVLFDKEVVSVLLKIVPFYQKEADLGKEEEKKETAPVLKKKEEKTEKGIRSKILVVDDMKSNLQMMQDMLGEDYTLILAKSGRQALTYLERKGEPDLILMDIDMPDMDGIETARQIKARAKKEIPLVFVTSLCDRETIFRCRELKPESYIVRPYKPVYVKTEVQRILEGWEH